MNILKARRSGKSVRLFLYPGALGLLAILVYCLTVISFAPRAEPQSDSLVHALMQGYEERAAELIHLGLGEQACFPARDEERWCFPIHLAAQNGRLRILELLLANGADPNRRDFQGETPLMYLCKGFETFRCADYYECLDALVKAGCDVNATSMSGQSALHIAPSPTFLVELLLAAGADPNLKDHQGNTPLHMACLSIRRIGPDGSGSDGIPSLLVAGADPEIENDAGFTPMQLAVQKDHNRAASIIQRFQENFKKRDEQR